MCSTSTGRPCVVGEAPSLLIYYMRVHFVEVICTLETDFRYLRVTMGASSLPVRVAFVLSFQLPPSVKVSDRLKLQV